MVDLKISYRTREAADSFDTFRLGVNHNTVVLRCQPLALRLVGDSYIIEITMPNVCTTPSSISVVGAVLLKLGQRGDINAS